MSEFVNGVAVKTGAWTEEEDLLLLAWQQKYGNKWSKVAEHIPGRTGQQCAQRWRHKVNPNIKKDKWTEAEDTQLRKLVDKHGNKWAEIARHMDGRTDQQCMGRWTRHLDPKISRDAWRLEEDTILLELYAKHGSQWSRISKILPGRTSQQCRQRFCQLHPELTREAGGAGPVSGGTYSGGEYTERNEAKTEPRTTVAAGGAGAGRASKRKRAVKADRDEWWGEDDDEYKGDEEEDWAMEQRAVENYKSASQRRAEKGARKEAGLMQPPPLIPPPELLLSLAPPPPHVLGAILGPPPVPSARRRGQQAHTDTATATFAPAKFSELLEVGGGKPASTTAVNNASMPLKKRGRSHSVAQPASVSPGGAGRDGKSEDPLLADDPLATIMRMGSVPANMLTHPPDYMRGLFSPEAAKPADKMAAKNDSGDVTLLDGPGQRTPLLTGGVGAHGGAGAGAMGTHAHPPNSVAPPSAPWKLTPTAHVFSPGFVMNTGYELPTPITVLRRLGANPNPRDGILLGKDVAHLDLPFYPLEPLMQSPGGLLMPGGQGGDTPGVLMNRPSRMPTESAPSAFKAMRGVTNPTDCPLTGPSPLGMGLPPLIRAASEVDALLAGRPEDEEEPRDAGAGAGPSPSRRKDAPTHHDMAAPSTVPAPATQEAILRNGSDQATTTAAPPSSTVPPASAVPGTRQSDQTFLSPTPRNRHTMARVAGGPLDDPWTPSGALQPSSVRPPPVSRLLNPTLLQANHDSTNLAAGPVAAAAVEVGAAGGQQTLCQAGLVPLAGKENRKLPLAEKRHAVYALLDEGDV